MPRPAVLLATLLLGTLPGLAMAGLEVEIRDRTDGRTLPVHWSEGRRYVVGEPRHEYGIRLRNRSGERVLAVVSVDGVNVVSGETASPAQSGYVLEPWQETTITGWRKSLERVAAFYFTSLPDAYAARTGRPDEVGVIGVAVFHERRRPTPLLGPAEPSAEAAGEARDSAAADSKAGGARRERSLADEAAAQRLGTGHGRRLDSRVSWTGFERASESPADVVAFHYDSRRNLVARGVLPPDRYARRVSEPFPAAFVPDPR